MSLKAEQSVMRCPCESPDSGWSQELHVGGSFLYFEEKFSFIVAEGWILQLLWKGLIPVREALKKV